MNIKIQEIYPNCHMINRTVEVGGLTKSQLIHKMRKKSILINKLGETLFEDDKFTTSDSKYTLQTVELAVQDLGFLEGGTVSQIFRKSNQLGLKLCPLELAPYLRLAYLDQTEGNLNRHRQHKAPYGSVTVASPLLTEDHDFPKGFYLRRIDGALWLRGYVCDDMHIWEPDDHFIFVKQ